MSHYLVLVRLNAVTLNEILKLQPELLLKRFHLPLIYHTGRSAHLTSSLNFPSRQLCSEHVIASKYVGMSLKGSRSPRILFQLNSYQ